MISLVLSLLAIGGLAIAGFGVFMITQAVSRRNSTRAGVLLTAVGLVIAILFFVMGAGVVEIQPNEVGVVFNTLSGSLADYPVGTGAAHHHPRRAGSDDLLRRPAGIHHVRQSR